MRRSGGVSSILTHDPIGRTIWIYLPNGFYRLWRHVPWKVEAFDEDDPRASVVSGSSSAGTASQQTAPLSDLQQQVAHEPSEITSVTRPPGAQAPSPPGGWEHGWGEMFLPGVPGCDGAAPGDNQEVQGVRGHAPLPEMHHEAFPSPLRPDRCL